MNVRQSASEIESDAARWVMRIDREGRSPDVEADLKAWLAGDSRRAGALLQAEAVWSMTDRARLLEPAPRRAPFGRVLAAAAATAAAVVLVGVLLLERPDSYVTEVGEVRRVPLSDGSSASINTASRLEVEMGERVRRVRLDRGEAWFQVAKDAARPFRVEIGRVRVEAVGTAFSVRRLEGGAEVRVTEGVVRTWVEGAARAPVALAAGAVSIVDERAGPATPRVEPAAIDRELAWRAGRIDLAGETLAEAAAEFNRYNARPVVIADPALADERLYGVFRLDDPESFAASVGLSLSAPVAADEAAIRIGDPPG
ncbi:MAG: FecR domain-containing protein [Brevundimonas sp.]|uniref:FecR family protein n=1 Tax=Brevundimonas sp. TaxID=1871086 RepID=UPI0017E508DC|nr:FecR domain-containing protein [Brevundimonas sp.]MBA4805142.1 FecR domain-containing protein [Brevundimonas sp.]